MYETKNFPAVPLPGLNAAVASVIKRETRWIVWKTLLFVLLY